MGYTVTTPCRDAAAQKKMIAFLDEHYKSPDTFLKWEDDGLRGPITSDFAYSDGDRLEIGFDYTSWASGKEFATSLCRWMALQVGDRKRMPVFEGHPEDVTAEMPYYIYDGNEEFPVRLKATWYPVAPKVCKGWTFVDEHGWVSGCKGYSLLSLVDLPNLKKMHTELKWLSELWTELENRK